MAEEEKKEEAVASEETSSAEAEGSSEASVEARQTDEVGQVPEKFKKFVDEVENMTVLELHELVKILEEKFGVSAQAVAVAAPGAGAEGGAEEQDAFKVELKSAGEQKIAVIKVVKEVLALGLKEAKDMVDGAPTVLKEGVKKEEAEEIKQKIEEAGGTVELK